MDSLVVTVGQASIDVGRTISGQIHVLFSELQKFFQSSDLWNGLSDAEITKPSYPLHVKASEWEGVARGSWHDGTIEDDFGAEVKVKWGNHVAVVQKSHTRTLPTGQQPSKIREGCTVEIHLPPLWIPARVVQHNPDDTTGTITVSQITSVTPVISEISPNDEREIADPLPRFSLDEPEPSPPPTKPSHHSPSHASSKSPTLPHNKSPTLARNKSPTIPHNAPPHPHTTPNPTRKPEKHPSPQKRRAETSKDKRSPNVPRNHQSPLKKIPVEVAGEIDIGSEIKPKKLEEDENLQANKWCDNDQEMVAVVFCQACKMKLCESCDKSIHANPPKKSHFRKPFKASSNKVKCANDEENDAGLYCKGCDMHFCLECDIYLHKNPAKKGHERVIL
eukprot:Phypoly_transcript_10548.p1 GENE.Phypoly_transcript_10548~~Phypoly_transcript_10548.p1  ORF type:complete len:416 (+),score=80.68 Phypoly_transcript_10548:78-1250(+)